MKVTIATGLYPPQMGGPATYARMLEEELPQQGIELNVVPYGWVRRYPKIVRHFVYAYKLWKESKDSDIIYALDPVSVGLPAKIISTLTRKTFWIRLGGDYAWEQGMVRFGVTDNLDEFWENQEDWPTRVKFLARIQSHVTSNAEKVIVPSEYLKGIVEKWGVETEKINVIYSALYPLETGGDKESIRRSLSFSQPTILSVGRMVPWKGFGTLIGVVKDLREFYPDLLLVIMGEGEDRDKLNDKIKEHGLEDNVRLTDRVSKDALGKIIWASDVFVLNTAYEGLSHQLIEVMDIGTPIVTTNAGGNPELITDGIEGFLVEFDNQEQLAESIRRVLDHEDTRERITKSARLRSKEFQKDKVIEKLVELINETSG